MRIIASVVTRARSVSVEKMADGMYKVRVRAVPEKGRANDAVCVALAEYFGITPSAVHIVAGATTRKKMIDIDGIDA